MKYYIRIFIAVLLLIAVVTWNAPTKADQWDGSVWNGAPWVGGVWDSGSSPTPEHNFVFVDSNNFVFVDSNNFVFGG